MTFETQFEDINRYLESIAIIDYATSPEIMELSREIAADSYDEIFFVKNAFEYVRDKISHSADIGGSVVTCVASEVLRERHGVCYAKSHLLAAILRGGQIPAGFCYQRLILDDELQPVFVLHALNAVFLRGKWIRLDARGNKPGVCAQFSLEEERLAFPVRPELGEMDFPEIFAVPDKNVMSSLSLNKNFESLWRNLPTELHGGLYK